MKIKTKKLASDASARTFYRVLINKKSKILVSAKKNKYSNLIAYTAVNKFLRDKNFLAPKLFSYNYKKGTILIEDFGDKTFYKILNKKKNKLPVYKKLVNLLLDLQKIKPKERIKNIKNNYHVIKKYSTTRLISESNIFFDWYLSSIYKKKKSEEG